MHFVFVSYNYSPGFTTPESWVERIKAYTGSLSCLAQNHKVSRVEQINFSGEYQHNGIHYYFTDFKKQTKFPLQLNRFVKNLKPDVVIVAGLLYPLQVIQLRLVLGDQTKIIAQHHAEQPFTGIKKYMQRLASKCTDAYFFASHDIGLNWAKKGNISSAKKIHEVMEVSSVFYPIDKSEAKSRTKVNGSPVFLWVGRLNANKDPLTVINAFLKFAAVQTGAVLYMIFHTDELLNEISHLLESHPYKNAIILIGKVRNDDLLYWYNSADFVVSGSHYEGSGTAICEAMSCGCVPVVTDIASFRMITNNGKCGVLFEAGNEAALLTALLQTKEIDIVEKQKLSLEYFKSNLSFEAIANRMEAIAKSI